MRILGLSIAGILVLVMAAVIAVQTPAFQTRAARWATEKFLNEVDGEVTFDEIHFRPFNTLVVKNLLIRDKNPQMPSQALIDRLGIEEFVPQDTVVTASYVVARFSLWGAFQKQGLHLSKVIVRDGFFNLVSEAPRFTSIHRVFGIPQRDTLKERVRSDRNLFDARRVDLINFGYSMQNIKDKRKPIKAGCIDWGDLEIRGIDATARNLKMSKGIMTGTLENCSFREKSGYVCHEVSGRVAVGGGQAVIENIHIRDDWSDVRLHHYTMHFVRPWYFQKYPMRVRMDALLNQSHLNFKTLGYFAQGLSGMTADIDVKGGMDGYVRSFQLNDITLSSRRGEFAGTVSGTVSGLPDLKNMQLDLDLKDLRTSTSGIQVFAGGFTKGKRVSFGNKVPQLSARADGKVSGSLNDLDVDVRLATSAGNASTDIRVKHLMDRDTSLDIDGDIRTDNLNLGKLLDNKLLGGVSLKSSLHAVLRDDNGPQLQIDTLKISKLNFKGYDYKQITAIGKVSEKSFEGRIISQDPNFNFLFQGIFNLSPKTRNAVYRFYANVGHADLHALNFDKREVSNLSMKTVANFTKTASGDLLGDVTVQNLTLENAEGRYNIGDISLDSRSSDDSHSMKFTSSFAEGEFDGSASVIKFVGDLVGLTAKSELPALFKDSSYEWSGQEYSLDFRCVDTYALTSFIKPGLFVDNNTALKLGIDRDGSLDARLTSHRLAIWDKYLKDIDCRIWNDGGKVSGDLHCDEIRVSSLLFRNNDVSLLADDNNVGLGLTTGIPDETETEGEFFARGEISRTDRDAVAFHVGVLPSGFKFNGEQWGIMPSDINVCGKDISIDNMQFESGRQGILIDGGLSADRTDTLSVSLDRFGLAIINNFLKDDALDIGGYVTGEALITSGGDTKGVIADFEIDSTAFAGVSLGLVKARSKWDEDYKRFNVYAANFPKTFSAAGHIVPSQKMLDLDLSLDRFDVAIGKPFLAGVFSDMGGCIDGNIHAEGPFSQIELSGDDLRMDNAMLCVGFTNVPYFLNGPFSLDSHGVHMDSLTATDGKSGKASVRGGLKYDHFKDISLDLHFDAKNIMAIDIPEKDNPGFYGTLTATGGVALTGPLNAVGIDVDVATSGPGTFHVPLSSAGRTETTNLLKFKEKEEVVEVDAYELIMSSDKVRTKKSASDLNVRIKADATNSVDAFIDIDKFSGNGLSGRGAGHIEVEVRPSREIFNLKGDYTLESGNFKFVALGIATRDFAIKDGSSVKFNGAVMDTDLNIDALYRTKTSISTLIADTTSVNSRRLVECGINITGKLREPVLAFSVDIPDLEPSVKAKVENALSTEDKVQKQFISLLVTNSFIPDEMSGIANNTGALYSNLTEIMSTQLNNILQKLNIPVDLGLSYQKNEKGNDVFDVAVSTQLFNNRVVVNGNIGNRQYKNSGSDVAGDIDVEVKLDREGAFRLNLFSHSADQYTNYLDNTQRNGIGFTFQQEYNNFGYMMRHLFARKQKKEEMELQEAERLKEEGETVITVTPEPEKKVKRKDRK